MSYSAFIVEFVANNITWSDKMLKSPSKQEIAACLNLKYYISSNTTFRAMFQASTCTTVFAGSYIFTYNTRIIIAFCITADLSGPMAGARAFRADSM